MKVRRLKDLVRGDAELLEVQKPAAAPFVQMEAEMLIEEIAERRVPDDEIIARISCHAEGVEDIAQGLVAKVAILADSVPRE